MIVFWLKQVQSFRITQLFTSPGLLQFGLYSKVGMDLLAQTYSVEQTWKVSLGELRHTCSGISELIPKIYTGKDPKFLTMLMTDTENAWNRPKPPTRFNASSMLISSLFEAIGTF
jgi:hypothetical protein